VVERAPATGARGAVHLDRLPSGGYLLRLAKSPVGALRALAGAVDAAHTETTVVCAAGICARPDLLTLVGNALDTADPTAVAVRIVLLGLGADQDTLRCGYPQLATRLGRLVIGSLAAVAVASDGSCAVATSIDKPGAWYACFAERTAETDVPWSPRTDWTDSAVLPAPVANRRLLARAVPAGWWLVPPDLPAAQWGVVPCVRRDPRGMRVFVGGCGYAVPAGDVAELLTTLALPASMPIILLPAALTGPVSGADLGQPAVPGIPVLSARGWGIQVVGHDGTLPPPSLPSAPAVQPAPPTDRPDYPVAWRVPGRRTQAGWSFLDRTGVGHWPVVAGPLVEVDGVRGGFVIGSGVIDARRFARLVATVIDPGDGPLVLAGSGRRPPRVLRALAATLGTTVLVADRPTTLTATGLLSTTGTWRAWPPAGEPADLGPHLPPRGVGMGRRLSIL
jgi:hypothetical protein